LIVRDLCFIVEVENNRHAYLILAHNQPRLLQVLIDMSDDERNDIFIHIDAKADMNQFSNIRAEKSGLYYTERKKVYWGDFSVSKTELFLLETAHRNGPYLYYHILSGVDLPLKNQDYIHHLMDDLYRGREFVGIAKQDKFHEKFKNRVRYYHLFSKHFRNHQRIGNYLSVMRKYAIALQKKNGIRRNGDVVLGFGPQWMSITDDLCQFILARKREIIKRYHHTFIADESFVQTIVYDSPFYERIYDVGDEYRSCGRLIDWEKGPTYPHIWTNQDWEELTTSDRLFARKFSEDDMDFIYRLKEHVLNSDTK
jgi:hypothetical protein